MYKVVYLDQVEEDFQKLDPPVRKKIVNKIEWVLAKDPKGLGTQLSGQFQGLWRYRIGDYRVIYKVAEQEILVIVARIGHRKDIYR